MQIYATELMGAEAYDAQGHFVGRVREFFVEPADQPNRISHFLLSRGRFQPLLARYNQVAAVIPGTIRLNCSEQELTLYTPNEAWLAVRKDLLDQQIIDTQGRKVVRVNDVDLAEQKSNGNVELRLTQVDVGLPGAVRRLLRDTGTSGPVGSTAGDGAVMLLTSALWPGQGHWSRCRTPSKAGTSLRPWTAAGPAWGSCSSVSCSCWPARPRPGKRCPAAPSPAGWCTAAGTC